jgi:hypothetical protein
MLAEMFERKWIKVGESTRISLLYGCCGRWTWAVLAAGAIKI